MRLDEPIEVEAPPLCTDQRVSIRHIAAWPGHGVGVRLRVDDPAAGASDLLAEGALALGPAGGEAVPMTAATVPAEPGFVVLALDGSTAAQATAREIVAALPAGTRVGLFQRCSRLRQVAAVTSDLAHLRQTLQTPLLACEGTPEPWADALAMAGAEAFSLGSRVFPAERAVIVVTDTNDYDPSPLPEPPMGVDAYVVSPSTGDWTTSAGIEGFALDAGVARRVVDRLAARAQRIVQAGACLPGASGASIDLRFATGATCPIEVPSGPAEEQALACDPAIISAGAYRTPSRIEFAFTADERAIFDQIRADKVHDEFAVTVTVGDADAVPAVAHLRGATTINCKRKSFTVDLDGGAARVLGPGFASDEFHLISMCSDDRYYQQFTANLLMASLGLFPMRFDLTELVIDGKTWGVYLLLQKPKEAALESTSRLQTIVRRRNDYRDEAPEIEYPSGLTADSPQVAPYWALLDGLNGLAGDDLVSEARSRYDLTGHLTLVAFHSLMQTGDFTDETYFYSTESAYRPDLDEWFRVHAWDMDDVFGACHHEGQYAMPDEFGMLYCVEGDLELRLLADPAVYALFVEALDGLIRERVTASAVDAALDTTGARLLPFFDRPGLPAAMIELVGANPAAVDASTAKADIQAAIDQTKLDFRARRDELAQRIDNWRQQR